MAQPSPKQLREMTRLAQCVLVDHELSVRRAVSQIRATLMCTAPSKRATAPDVSELDVVTKAAQRWTLFR